MATLTAEDMADMVKSTLRHLAWNEIYQIATQYQDYEVVGRLMKTDKIQFDTGRAIQKNIMVDHTDAAKHVGLYEVDTINITDLLQTMTAPWRHVTTNWAWEFREQLMNTGAAKIVDMIKTRRAGSMIALAEELEPAFWGCPSDSDNDQLDAYGIYYWITKHTSGTSATTGGFNGGSNLIYTSGPGGLNPSTYAQWCNYTAKYANVSKDDLVKKMRRAHRLCNWKSPMGLDDFRTGRGDTLRIYTTESVLNSLELIGEQQNENLGRDIASMDEVTVFRRHPIVWVPYLDNDTDNPVFLIDLKNFYPVFLKGDYMRETGPQKAANQHNVWVVFVDTTYNYVCTCRRTQAVLSTGQAYPSGIYE